MRWLNCTIKRLSMPRVMRNGHTARHLRISGVPLYQQLAPGTNYCVDCDNILACSHSADGEVEAWTED